VLGTIPPRQNPRHRIRGEIAYERHRNDPAFRGCVYHFVLSMDGSVLGGKQSSRLSELFEVDDVES